MQSCKTCIHFKRWEGTILGDCNWNKPTPPHIRRYGSSMKVEKKEGVPRGGHDFGENCPAWEGKHTKEQGYEV